jgi:hypothetical protein
VTTEALIFLGQLDPEAVGPSIEFATHDEPTPVDEAVLLAAERPYRQVIGVEISPALDEIAKENRDRYPRSRLAGKDVRLVRADAATFAFPRGDLAIDLYNRFRAPILDAVVARLAVHAGGVAIAYHTALERASIDVAPQFTEIAAFPFGTVWRKP